MALNQTKPFESETGGPPLYVRLADTLRRRIEFGAWPVGSQIPPLRDLIAETGAARETVRRALGVLDDEGLIERHLGRGTFVVRRPQLPVWEELEMDWQTLVRAHDGISTDTLACEPAAPPHPSHDGGRPAPGYQFLNRRHRRDGVAYLIGYAFIDSRIWARLSQDSVEHQPLIRVLNDLPGVTIRSAQQTVSVISADSEIARHLEVPFGSPVVVVDRSVTDDANVLILETRGFYRADFVKLSMRLK